MDNCTNSMHTSRQRHGAPMSALVCLWALLPGLLQTHHPEHLHPGGGSVLQAAGAVGSGGPCPAPGQSEEAQRHPGQL